MFKVEWNAIHGAYFYALRCIKVANALGAFVRINFVYVDTLVNRRVWALRLTDVAIDTLVSDLECQVKPTFRLCL